ncbi:helix-turn-helix domain-containing protein [Flavobacterium rhizosphaerae]|uniref:AraC family transcriptional regulator n=1 Tax=Flavobacterium rhizosphaerae TaxID=3163298 RepID=A0ABW8YVZ4_9FLAO
MDTLDTIIPAIRYSCYFTRSRVGEQFVPEHSLVYVLSGKTVMTDVLGTKTFTEGNIYFCRRNSLAKFEKEPGKEGEYRSVSIFLTRELLHTISLKYGYKAGEEKDLSTFHSLENASLLADFMQSLKQYENLFSKPGSQSLMMLKQEEAVLLLVQLYPKLVNILFDFSEPGKIDLEAFMKKNYHFNVSLERFAYLTGRSLSTFKRDFEKIFSTTPNRWLQQRRLQEAFYLIKEKGKSVSEVYLDLGFENLSHFSYAFKKQFGLSPSQVR